jgi:phospholipase C
MNTQNLPARMLGAARMGLCSLALTQLSFGAALASAVDSRNGATRTPIKHVIVIIGENRSFDHVFATYVPRKGETVNNLLSEGIVKLDRAGRAIPGPNWEKAHQLAAADKGSGDAFLLSPPKEEFPSDQLPAPLVGGPTVSYIPNMCAAGTPIADCEASLTLAQQSESGLPENYYADLLTGGTGQAKATPDERITDVNNLPAGPFQLTNGTMFHYDAYSASPVHRFYQMWQQLNCSVERSTRENPSGCDAKLFSWVEVTVGAGANGAAQPASFSTEYSPSATTTGEGSSALGFYNVQQGDVPYFKSLADKYAMSDNFHQSVNGGTGANHIMFGHADMIWYSDASGRPATPPENVKVFTQPYQGGTNPDAGTVSEIENPNPAAGTNNWYSEDGLSAALHGVARFGRRLVQQLLQLECSRSQGGSGLSRLAPAPGRAALRARTLLFVEQLQPGVFRQRQECLDRP